MSFFTWADHIYSKCFIDQRRSSEVNAHESGQRCDTCGHRSTEKHDSCLFVIIDVLVIVVFW